MSKDKRKFKKGDVVICTRPFKQYKDTEWTVIEYVHKNVFTVPAVKLSGYKKVTALPESWLELKTQA